MMLLITVKHAGYMDTRNVHESTLESFIKRCDGSIHLQRQCPLKRVPGVTHPSQASSWRA